MGEAVPFGAAFFIPIPLGNIPQKPPYSSIQALGLEYKQEADAS